MLQVINKIIISNLILILLGVITDNIVLSLVIIIILNPIILLNKIYILEDERKELDRILILQSRQNTIGNILSNVLHDWKAPLSKIGIISTSLNLKAKLNKEISNKEIENLTTKIDSTLSYLSNTIDTFENFFLGNKKNISYINLKESITETIEFISDILETNRIKINLTLEENCIITGDKNYLSHILMNLLLNSKDAFHQREIKEIREINIRLYKNNKQTCIKISDNAGGINIKPINEIFMPYKTTKMKKGMGLGLFTVKQMIEKSFNGKIEAENINKGAQFIITINEITVDIPNKYQIQSYDIKKAG